MKKIIYFFCFAMLLLSSCNQDKHLWRIQQDGLYGFVDSLGNVVIEPQYRYVGNFIGGYACVVTDMILVEKERFLKKDTLLEVKYGYINVDNEIVIDTTNIIQFRLEPDMETFPKNFKEKKFGFRTFILNDLTLRSDRFLFQDKESSLYGYKDSEGNVVIKPQYYIAHAFQSGRAIVTDTIKSDDYSNQEGFVKALNRTGAIDKDGNVKVKPEYVYITPFGRNGETWASYISTNDDSFNREWVLIDKDGKNVLPPNSMMGCIYNSSDSIYVCQLDFWNCTYYTFMDRNGNFLSDYNHDGTLNIPLDGKSQSEVFSDVTAFSDGYAGIKGQYDGKPVWYFANNKLDSNFTPYDSVLCFSDGIAAVKEFVTDEAFERMRSGKWGYIDIHANLVIPYKFDECGSFIGALAYFRNTGSTYDMEGYINKDGNIVWQTRVSKSK